MCWLSAQPRPLSSLLSLFFLNLAEDLLGGGRHIHRNLGGHILEAPRCSLSGSRVSRSPMQASLVCFHGSFERRLVCKVKEGQGEILHLKVS